jgi:epoxyqueuosine reductase
MSKAEHTETIKVLCRHWGASLVGVADLRSVGKNHVFMPASTVEKFPNAISVAYHLSDAILEDIDDHPTPHYFHHYQRVNIFLDSIGLALNTAIQDLAMPIASSQILDWKNQTGHLSHKHVARAAGLGWIGRNNLLISEPFGARIRLVTVLTDLPLVIDPPSTRGCSSCRDCIAVCPVGAIKERQEDFDHVGCYEQLKTFSKKYHLRHQICGICVKACRGRMRRSVNA